MIAAVYARKSAEQAIADEAKSVTRQVDTVVDVQHGEWGSNEPHDDVAAATDDGVWGVIPRRITHEPVYWESAA